MSRGHEGQAQPGEAFGFWGSWALLTWKGALILWALGILWGGIL